MANSKSPYKPELRITSLVTQTGLEDFFCNAKQHVYHCLGLMLSAEDSPNTSESKLLSLLALRWETEAQRWKQTATVSRQTKSDLAPSAHCLTRFSIRIKQPNLK